MIETTVAPVVDEDFIALALDHLKIEAGAEETAYADLVAQLSTPRSAWSRLRRAASSSSAPCASPPTPSGRRWSSR